MSINKDYTLSHELIHIKEGEDIVFYTPHDSSSYVSTHWHNAIEIIYITAGELEITIGDQITLLKEDNFILINSKVLHSTKCRTGNDAILLQIPQAFIKKYIPDINQLLFLPNCSSTDPIIQGQIMQIKEVLGNMSLIYKSSQDGAKLKFTSLLFELLYLLYQNFRTEVLQSDYIKRTKNLTRLEPLLQYTHDNYTRPISIEEMSHIAGLQPEYFCRFFKKNMGITYLEYLNQVRLSYIYEDLIMTEFPINHLLEMHGFTNYKLFRQMFKEHFHDTPSNIRNQSRG